MEYPFEDIFDIPRLTELCEYYTQTNGIVTALLDLDGNVHIQTGWQDICTKFHRVNPTSAKRCLESDTALAGQLAAGQPYNVYKCKNGLVDVAVPIHIDGEHVANFFTGQLLFEDPDYDYFDKQSKELGVDLIPYRNALDKVPIFKEEDIRLIMQFLHSLAKTIGEMGKARLDLLKLQEIERQHMREIELAKVQLEKLAAEDHLTGLKNRREFSRILENEFYRANRYQHDLSIAIVDTDYFKDINDTYGHLAGDEVLKAIAEILTASIRQSDIATRIGGDEFCIIFPESDSPKITQLVSKLCDTIANLTIPFNRDSLTITCSFGIASIDANQQDADDLVACADKALYKAKHSGRNCVVTYSPQ